MVHHPLAQCGEWRLLERGFPCSKAKARTQRTKKGIHVNLMPLCLMVLKEKQNTPTAEGGERDAFYIVAAPWE